MTPGDSVRVTIGGRMHDAEVLYTRGVSVRVRLADGREKTVPVDRVRSAKVVIGHPVARTKVGVRAEVAAILADDAAWEPQLTFTTRNGAPVTVERNGDYVTATAARARAVPKPKPPWRSSEYRAFVRQRRCCISSAWAEEVHHHGPHAMGRKGPDWTCIPLTHNAHDRFHATGVFDGMSREQTDAHAIKAQVRCMTAWCEEKGLDYMTAVRDALARVVEGDDYP